MKERIWRVTQGAAGEFVRLLPEAIVVISCGVLIGSVVVNIEWLEVRSFVQWLIWTVVGASLSIIALKALRLREYPTTKELVLSFVVQAIGTGIGISVYYLLLWHLV